MKQVTLLAVDLAKDVFQVAGFAKGLVEVFNRQVKRKDLASFMAQHPACDVAMEACYSSHYWARCFTRMGHRVRLLPAQHVTPFVRGNKSDHNDAIAIAEASQRPNIIAVPVKTVEQQNIQSLHRIRDLCVQRRTSLMNQTRGLLSEYGVISPKGHKAFVTLLGNICDPEHDAVSPILKVQFRLVSEEYQQLSDRIADIQKELTRVVAQQPQCQLISTIPGIGVINATAIYSAIGDGAQFNNAREFAVWLGLTPRKRQSGNTFSSGGITKRGDRYLRKQLVHGARALLYRCRDKTDRLSLWANALIARRGYNKACVAMAARLARLCWVLLRKNESYRAMK